jgi:hypothetical protein
MTNRNDKNATKTHDYGATKGKKANYQEFVYFYTLNPFLSLSESGLTGF